MIVDPQILAGFLFYRFKNKFNFDSRFCIIYITNNGTTATLYLETQIISEGITHIGR